MKLDLKELFIEELDTLLDQGQPDDDHTHDLAMRNAKERWIDTMEYMNDYNRGH